MDVKLQDTLVAPALLDALWPQIWPVLREAVENTGLETEEELLADLRAINRFLLIVGDGVAVVRNCGTFFEINYVAGTNAKTWWPAMSALIDQMAQAFGCKKIVAIGRTAWKRLAPDYTATETRIYTKEVA